MEYKLSKNCIEKPGESSKGIATLIFYDITLIIHSSLRDVYGDCTTIECPNIKQKYILRICYFLISNGRCSFHFSYFQGLVTRLQYRCRKRRSDCQVPKSIWFRYLLFARSSIQSCFFLSNYGLIKSAKILVVS